MAFLNSSCLSWFKRNGSSASRIDCIGCQYAWVPFVSSADILACPFSDHCAPSLVISIPSVLPSGPGLRKQNDCSGGGEELFFLNL